MRGVLRKNESLARYTSWRVGGKARQTYRPADLADLVEFLSTISTDENLVWIGLGSNVLIRDGGINGTVILTQGRLNKLEQSNEKIIRAEAGVTCAKMAKYCVKMGFPAGAFFAGVPGTIGGALAMNAGAFGGETWPYVIAVETVDRRGEIKRRLPQDFKIGYREVVRPKDEWFLAGHFVFPPGDMVQAAQDIRELLRKRTNSQPIGEFSCGSVFRNPPGDFAARLIEASGLKGLRQGNAWVSEKHANFIINGGKATATDIENLINLVQQQVEEKQGVHLTPEVHILGDR
jgi:UDP-N-acetylmuramate dehydrogenase